MSANVPDIKERIEIEEKVRKPPMYKVLIYNDDYTTKEFVVELLITVFHKSRQSAIRLMFSVHNNGVGVCGIYPAHRKTRSLQGRDIRCWAQKVLTVFVVQCTA